MAVSITLEGGALKVDKGADPTYYPTDDLTLKVDDSEISIVLFRNGKAVDSWAYSDIASPAGATIEAKADAIAALFTSSSSTTVSGNVTVVQSTAANLNANVSGTVTANIGTIADIATNTTLTSIKTAVELIDNAISGSEMQVDVVSGTLTSITNVVTTKIEGSATASLTNVTSSATNVTIKAANANRKYLTIYNDSTRILYIKFGATASTTSFTYRLTAGDTITISGDEWNGIVDGIWNIANGNARVTETTS